MSERMSKGYARHMDAELLAEAMAAEFDTSLPVDEAGWREAAKRILESVERA
jgi:hypothetical protein